MSTSEQAANRPGTWPRGTSGNPGGRPRGIEALARVHTTEALAVLVDALSDPDRRVAVSAAGMLLAYGWGRPKQLIAAPDDATSLTLMHLVAARACSDQLAAEREAAEHRQPLTINGEATSPEPLGSIPVNLFEPALE